MRGEARMVMRLYRGLKGPYRPDEVRSRVQRTGGTDFTDCPFTALAYAAGRNGVVLVLDVVDDVGLSRVTGETWFVDSARRFMVWGGFDGWLVAAIPAKELRAEFHDPTSPRRAGYWAALPFVNGAAPLPVARTVDNFQQIGARTEVEAWISAC